MTYKIHIFNCNKCKMHIWIMLRLKTHNTLCCNEDKRCHFYTDEYVHLYHSQFNNSSILQKYLVSVDKQAVERVQRYAKVHICTVLVKNLIYF